jgi:hypothetical protein
VGYVRRAYPEVPAPPPPCISDGARLNGCRRLPIGRPAPRRRRVARPVVWANFDGSMPASKRRGFFAQLRCVDQSSIGHTPSMRRTDSRDRAVRRSTRRATRCGSPRVRLSFLRSSPGQIARARLRTSTSTLSGVEPFRSPTSTAWFLVPTSGSHPQRKGGGQPCKPALRWT